MLPKRNASPTRNGSTRDELNELTCANEPPRSANELNDACCELCACCELWLLALTACCKLWLLALTTCCELWLLALAGKLWLLT